MTIISHPHPAAPRDTRDASRAIVARAMQLMETRHMRAGDAYRLARVEAGEIAE